MANYPHGNIPRGNLSNGNTQYDGTDRRPFHLGFSPSQSLGFEQQIPPPRSRSPSYLIYTPSFISFKVTNLHRVLRFSMNRTEINVKSILKCIKRTTKVKAKSLFMREIGGAITRIDNDLILQYQIEQMEARQRREGTASEMELLIGDKHGSIFEVPPTQEWMHV